MTVKTTQTGFGRRPTDQSVRTQLASPRTKLTSEECEILQRVLETDEYDYVDNPVFHQRNAEKAVFDEAPPIDQPDTSWYQPLMENLDTDPLNKGSSKVLLTAAEEQALFLQFNYCRYRVAKLLRKVRRSKSGVTAADARELIRWERQVDYYRDQIAQINLALVLAMAKRTKLNEIDFGEMVSEGNMALLRAIEKFDVARGFKFSTYACRAILKGFSRMGMKNTRYRQLFPTDFDPSLERSDFSETKNREHELECADELRSILDKNRANLSDIEQEVIEHRFAMGGKSGTNEHGNPLTLEQVGKIIGVTKERVRQIQNKALVKLRESLEEDYLS